MSAGDTGADEQLLDHGNARVFLCIFHHQARLGVAYYEEETGFLHVSETWETESFSNVQLIKMQVNPSMILVSSKADEGFMDAVTDNADSTYNFVVKVLSTKEFIFEHARGKIASLELLDMPDSLTHPLDRLEYFASVLDFENTYMIRATGALIHYLQRNLNSQLKVNNIVSFASDNYMFVDTCTLHSLQIFSTERHPSLLGKGKAKEGLSLFGITDHTKSSAGKRLLREWFLRPTVKVSIIEGRFEAVSFFVEGSLSGFITELQGHLKQIGDLASIVLRIRRASASVRDWENVLKTASNAWEIRRLCSSAEMEELKIYTKIMTTVDDNIPKIADLLQDVIDFEESKDAERIVIQHGVDKELDDAKQTYSFLDEYLTEVGKEEMQLIEGLDKIRIIYYPQIGFLISIPNVEDTILEATINRCNWDFQYETDESIFFKNDRMHELDDTIGDIHNNIADMEIAIAREMEAKVLEYSQQLIEVTRVCAELDCLLSLAITAREQNYVRPTITDENVIYISNGRHPLQELCVENNFIPNDTAIAANREGSVKMITGPNYSGKSVYLKQVGLITYMAHVGSFVPADGAIIGICDKLFTRIHTRETASLAQSSFMIDCHQVALMTRHATERSLLLIDEFGKGTNPNDGIALLYGTMEYLLKKEEECPKVLVTTHFARAVQALRQRDHPNLEFVTLDFIAQDESIDEITFLYRVVGGVSEASYGLQCCELAGLASAVVSRAKYTRACIAESSRIAPIDEFEDITGETQTLVESFLTFNFTTSSPRLFSSLLSSSQHKRHKRKNSEDSSPPSRHPSLSLTHSPPPSRASETYSNSKLNPPVPLPKRIRRVSKGREKSNSRGKGQKMNSWMSQGSNGDGDDDDGNEQPIYKGGIDEEDEEEGGGGGGRGGRGGGGRRETLIRESKGEKKTKRYVEEDGGGEERGGNTTKRYAEEDEEEDDEREDRETESPALQQQPQRLFSLFTPSPEEEDKRSRGGGGDDQQISPTSRKPPISRKPTTSRKSIFELPSKPTRIHTLFRQVDEEEDEEEDEDEEIATITRRRG